MKKQNKKGKQNKTTTTTKNARPNTLPVFEGSFA